MNTDLESGADRPTPNHRATRLAREALRIEENALYTGNANFARAQVFERLRLILGVPATVAGAAAGASYVLEQSKSVAALLAFLAATLTALVTFLNPEREATTCHIQGARYVSLENALRRYRLLDIEGLDPDEARARLEEFAELAKHLDDSNRAGEWAFRQAQKKVKSGDLAHQCDRDTPGSRNPTAVADATPTIDG
jgi:hypothetical protein